MNGNTAQPLVDLEEKFWDGAGVIEEDMEKQLSGEVKLEIPKKMTRSICGFTFEEEDEVKTEKSVERLSRRKEAAETFRANAAALREQLAGIGVKPLAVIPATVWDRLCNEAGLYRFERIDTKGEVGCHNPFPNLMYQTLKMSVLLAVMMICGYFSHAKMMHVVLAAAYLGTAFACTRRADAWTSKALEDDLHFWPLLAFFGTSMVLGAPAGYFVAKIFIVGQLATALKWYAGAATVAGTVSWLLAGLSNYLCEGARPHFGTICLRMLPHKSILKMLWPDAIDTRSRDLKLFVRFPSPPADVAKTLKAIADAPQSYYIRVAAVPEAISLDAGNVKDALRRAQEEEKRRREAAKDPIVYLRSGELIAVVAQFGELAIEKAVIDRVTKVDYLPA